MKAEHLRKFNFLALPKFGKKYRTTNKIIPNHFPCCLSYGCTTHHSPGKNREAWGTSLISKPCPEHCGFCVSSGWKLDHKDCRSVIQAGTRVHKTHNSVLWSSLSNIICRHQRNVLLLRNVAWYSLPVASVCNLLDRTYILTANLKFPSCQHTKYKLHK